MLWWLIWHAASQTYMFWKHGIEKQATIVSFDSTSTLIKGGIVFHYALNIDNHIVIKGFRNQLPIGMKYSVIVLNEGRSEDDVVLGTKKDGLLNIYSAVVGGKMMAVILTFLLIPCLVVTTWLLPTVIKKTWEHE